MRRLLGARDDVGLDRARVAPAQQLAERPERAHDLLGRRAEPAQVGGDQRPPLRDLAGEQRGPFGWRERPVGLVDPECGQDLADRGAVAGGVLADVELREVEAEHLDLPDRVVELGGGHEVAVDLAERLLSHPQLVEQLVRRAVAGVVSLARRAHARGEQREVAPVGLLRVAREGPRRLLRKALGQPRQRVRQLLRAPHEPLAQRHALREQLDPALEQVQAGGAHHLERLRGDRRGDARVAVAVAAHPRAERQQRRHADLLAGVGLLDRRLELAVELGHDPVQRRGEVDEPGVDLVERGGGGGAHLVGAPQLLDRAGDRAPGGRLVAGHGRALVEVAQAGEDARELLDRRAPPRLGRVRGHDEPQLGALERRAQLVRGRAALGEVADRVAQRAGARRVAEPALAPAQAPDALVVLREVEELEPTRERAHQHLGVVERQRGDELLELASGGVLARARALAERGGALVEVHRIGALARRQDGGEQLAQERLVVHERAPAEVAQRGGSGVRRHALESRRENGPRIGLGANIWARGLDRARMRA